MSAAATVLFLITLPMTTLTSFAEHYQCGAADDPVAVACYREEVKDFLQSWVVAWGKGDVDQYLEHYAPFGSPKPNMTRQEWEAERRLRLSNSANVVVTLELDSMGISEDGSLDVIFVQSFQSPTYRDIVKKQLFLKRHDQNLVIQREVTLSQP